MHNDGTRVVTSVRGLSVTAATRYTLMRTTITIDDDVLIAARAIALSEISPLAGSFRNWRGSLSDHRRRRPNVMAYLFFRGAPKESSSPSTSLIRCVASS